MESEKDLYENNLVVGDILEKVKPFADKILSEKTAVIDSKNLAHLKKKIHIYSFQFQNPPTLTAESRFFHQTKFLGYAFCPFTINGTRLTVFG